MSDMIRATIGAIIGTVGKCPRSQYQCVRCLSGYGDISPSGCQPSFGF